MTLNDFIAKNPSREQIAEQICFCANNYVLHIDDTFVWGKLSELGGFTIDDFYDDQEETRRRYEDDAVDKVGIVNWKWKEGNKFGIFKKEEK